MYQEQKNTSNTFRYDAFISYRHLEEDKEIAQTLQGLLEKYVIMDPVTNKKRHIKVFRDQSELPVSDDLAMRFILLWNIQSFLLLFILRQQKILNGVCGN